MQFDFEMKNIFLITEKKHLNKSLLIISHASSISEELKFDSKRKKF